MTTVVKVVDAIRKLVAKSYGSGDVVKCAAGIMKEDSDDLGDRKSVV